MILTRIWCCRAWAIKPGSSARNVHSPPVKLTLGTRATSASWSMTSRTSAGDISCRSGSRWGNRFCHQRVLRQNFHCCR